MKVLESRRRQRGVVLIVALIVLMLMSLLAAVSMRSASSAEEVANQSRLRTLALQAAEAALAHCEREVRANAVDASKGFAPQAAAVGAGVKFDWEVLSNWDSVPAASMVKTVAFAAAGDAPGAAYFRRPPECMAQYLSPTSTKSFVTTARGFGPDVAAKSNRPPDGAEVWLQSIVTLN